MKMNQMKLGLAALTIVASAGASAAGIKSNADAITVDARGLNLNNEHGQEVLYTRLTKAAKQVCGETTVHGAGSLKQAMENRTCYSDTLSKAVESVGNDGLNSIHKRS